MIKVSIIVPIYNAGHRLHECLDTLVNQTLREIEIICVLDCPTDGSDKIAEEYAARDSRMNLIYNETNLHVAESRNRGMAAAKGEYIGFSDHDDTRRLDMYEKLYIAAKKNDLDIVFSNAIIRINNKKKILYQYNDTSKEGVISSLVIGDNPANKNYLSATVWASIYKREVIYNNKLVFYSRKEYLEEDRPFNLSVFLLAKKVGHVNEAFYVWNKHESSLSEEWGVDEGLTRLSFFEVMTQTLRDANEFDHYRKEWVISLENSIRVYYVHYKNLKVDHKKRLGKLLYEGRFPIFGRYEDLKIISKKRIKLYVFVLNLYLDHFKSFY